MAVNGLLAVRERLKNFTALNAYFLANYGKLPRHFLGYKQIGNATFLPALCYVPTAGDRNSNFANESVSIVIQISNKDETEDAFNGVIQVNELADLIVESFTTNLVTGDFLIERGIKIINNFKGIHPFYEIAILITLGSVNNSHKNEFYN